MIQATNTFGHKHLVLIIVCIDRRLNQLDHNQFAVLFPAH